MLRYLKRRTSCVQICADYKAYRYRCIHVSPAFHAKASTYPALPCVKHCGIVAQHKIIESLPKQRTKYSHSQGTLSKTILSSLHDLPTKIALPTKLSPLPCSGTMSSSHAANCPNAYKILKRFKAQQQKLLIKSGDFP